MKKIIRTDGLINIEEMTYKEAAILATWSAKIDSKDSPKVVNLKQRIYKAYKNCSSAPQPPNETTN